MKKFFGLLLVAFFGLLSLGAFAQDTLVTSKGKYVLKDAYYAADTTFMFAAKIEKVFISEVAPIDNCRQVVNWDNTKFTKVIAANPDFVSYTVSTDNPKAKVEYSADNVIWQDSPVLKLHNSTNCEGIFFRLKGCENLSTWGCVVPFTTKPPLPSPPDVGIVKRAIFSSGFGEKNGRLSTASHNLTIAKSDARYFLGAVGWRDVSSSPQDGLSGYDYNPLVFEKGEQPWAFGDWIQNDVYATGKRAVGPEYLVDTTTRLYEFDVKFPEFSLPAGKVVAVDAETERSSDNMLKRGVTFAKSTTDKSKEIHFLGDEWLHKVGCPPAYSSSPAAFQAWLRNTPADVILRSFQDRVRNYTGYGYIMLNWEAVMFNVPDDQRYKLSGVFKWYAEQNYNAKLGAWMQAGFNMSRAAFEGDFRFDLYDGITNFKGTASEFRNRYKCFGGQPDYAKHLDVLLIGGYQNFATNDGIIHHYLLEYLANKKFFPSKLVLASIWHDQEHLQGWKLTPVTPAGAAYTFWNKPAVFNQTMYNWGVWTVAVGDGFNLWSDPVKWTNNVKDYPVGAVDFYGNQLTGTGGKMYARNNLKNIDWLMRGVWEVSQHSDIINAKTKWIFPVSVEDSYARKTVLTAYKLSTDGAEALVLSLDMFSGAGVNESPLPKPPFGQGITTNGTWTTVQRIKLH
jgi:hypothetical protein